MRSRLAAASRSSGPPLEMMEVVKRYKGERRRFYSGGYMGKKRRRVGHARWL